VKGLTAPGLLKAPLYLQCPPLESFSTGYAFSHADYDTVRAGQHSRPAGKQLRTVQFQTLLVDFSPSWAVWLPSRAGTPQPDPLTTRNALVKLLESGSPFRFRAINPGYWGDGRADLEMMATLRTLSVEERAGEPDARYLDLAFTEYRVPELGRKAKGSARHAGGGRARDLPYKHPVKKGDTLLGLAKKHYGKQGRWRVIAQVNGIRNLSQSGDLYAWARKHHRRYVTIPAVDEDGLVTQVDPDPTRDTEHFDPLG
jgi:hypothetical protein